METSELESSLRLSKFEKPLVIASYFGFIPIAPPKVGPEDEELVSHCKNHPLYNAIEKAALLRIYMEKNLCSLPHPLGLAYKTRRVPTYNLHYIGSPSGIAEASLIRAAISILSESGYKNLHLELNSIGDKDSLAFYERELVAFIKKQADKLGDSARQILREDVFNLFHEENEELRNLRELAPSALSYLSPQSRLHFKEVLEFVEGLDIEFELVSNLVGEKNHSSHTIFGIRADTGPLLATGYRYSRLSKRLGTKKEIPSVSVAIYLGSKGSGRVYKELPKPKFYLVQLGREAKIRTLSLLEELRRERIRVEHSLGKDKLSAQLPSIDNLTATHLIIIGHKEALDSTATVRNISTRAQDTIPLSGLPRYLKKISL